MLEILLGFGYLRHSGVASHTETLHPGSTVLHSHLSGVFHPPSRFAFEAVTLDRINLGVCKLADEFAY